MVRAGVGAVGPRGLANTHMFHLGGSVDYPWLFVLG